MRQISEKYLVRPFNHWKGNGVKELKNNIIVRGKWLVLCIVTHFTTSLIQKKNYVFGKSVQMVALTQVVHGPLRDVLGPLRDTNWLSGFKVI